jgi:hypothetical protein
MINWIDILALIPMLGLIFMAYRYLVVKRQNTNLAKMFMQSEVDKNLLGQQILQIREDKRLLESDEFMMFLNNSRQAAFDYIEDAQAGIKKFDEDVRLILLEENSSAATLVKILEANKQLQKLLPDSINKQ